MTVIVKVTAADPRASLSQLPAVPLGLDVWETGPDYVVLRGTEAQLERLEQVGYSVEQLYTTEAYLSTFATENAVAGYHSAEALEQDLHRLVGRQPEVAELHEIGRSLEGRSIWALRIGERRGSNRKVLFLGSHHGREWVAVEVAYLLAAHVVENASTNPVQELLAQGETWVAPMVNPDGHEYSRTHDRLWCNNRRPNQDGSFGVDLNRNYGYMWGTLNSNTASYVPRDETYVGRRAFSEPETRAVRNLIARELFGGVFAYRSYSQVILYPWGYTSEPITDPSDRTEMVAIADHMHTLIHDVHGETYAPQQSSEPYPAAGDIIDWTYGEYDIPSFTIKLGPQTYEQGGFILPSDQIQPTWEENWPPALACIRVGN